MMDTLGDTCADAQILQMMTFARCTFQVRSVVFYWVNEATEMVGFRREGISEEFLDRYCNGMNSLDPLLARRLAQQERKVAWLAEESAWLPEAASYLDFLGAHNIIDNLEFVFWNNGAPFAGLGVLRNRDDLPLQARTMDLDAMQKYLEFNLLMHPRLREARLRAALARRFRLTQREIEVVTLICAGASNQDIAAGLGVRLATAKTHVVNILDKLGVGNRSSVVGLTLSLD